MTFEVNQIIKEDKNYSECAQWCNENDCYIKEIDKDKNGERQFQICAVEHNEELEQTEKELTAIENRISEIKNELLTATLLDDTDTITALKAEYKELLNERV